MTTLLPSFVRSLRHFYFGVPHFHSLGWAKYYRTTSLKNLNLYESFPCPFFLQTLHFYEFVDLIKFSHFNFSQHSPSLMKMYQKEWNFQDCAHIFNEYLGSKKNGSTSGNSETDYSLAGYCDGWLLCIYCRFSWKSSWGYGSCSRPNLS